MLKYILIIFSIIVLWGCNETHTPKPRGFYRIDFPEKNYQTLPLQMPYSFEVPTYSICKIDHTIQEDQSNINILFPQNRSTFHISYKKINNNLQKLTEDSYELAYKHSIKANSISEQVYLNPANNVYGTIYRIEGNAASPFQFHLTDSTCNFLRGSFYIKEIPNYDSLQPVIKFLEKDLINLIETLHWEEQCQ